MGHMRNHTNHTNTTITVTQKFADGDIEIRFERDYVSTAGARSGLMSAIERETARWGRANGVSWQVAEQEAAGWDGRTPFAQTVTSWNRCGSLLFEAV